MIIYIFKIQEMVDGLYWILIVLFVILLQYKLMMYAPKGNNRD